MRNVFWRMMIAMKKKAKILSVLLAAALSMSVLLSGCSSQPTAEDARNYVKAVLDIMCTGNYDGSVRFDDIGEDGGAALRDEMLNEMIESLSDIEGMNDEVKALFRDFLTDALAKCRYSVGEAVKTEDNGTPGYDVTVTIEPLKVFEGASEAVNAEVEEIQKNTADLGSKTQEDLLTMIFKSVFRVLNKNLQDPHYEEPVDVVIHYGILDKNKNLYGIDEDAGARLSNKLFSMEGLD
jgi:methyl-accepting chemotaxis protein